MILFTTILAFVGLAFAVKEPTFAELTKQLYENDAVLQKVVANYEAMGYHTFANQSKIALVNEFLKSSIAALPKNASIHDKDPAVQNTLMLIEFDLILFDLFANASHSSDGVKAGILALAVNNKSAIPHGLHVPSREILIQKVMDTIHQEAGVMINGSLTKPDAVLEGHYADMLKISHDMFTITSNSSLAIATIIHNHCALLGAGCSVKLRQLVGEFLVADQHIRLNTRIDSQAKVNVLLSILPDYLRFRDEIDVALKAEHLECMPTGCKKIKPTEHPEHH